MRFVHLSDLHLGKYVNEYSMIEDQEYILKKVIEILKEERPDAVLIAGDVFDKSIPSAEAVKLWDDFVFELIALKIPVFVISGNHDSSIRVSANYRLLKENGLYLAPPYDGTVQCVTLKDEYGDLNVYLLPYIKPADVRAQFPDAEINNYTDAVRVAIDNMKVNSEARNLLVAHQFITGSSQCDSEDISVGGTDNVEATVFEDFDYVALGHLHGCQSILRETVRYCGTPIKYSFSEVKHKKTLTFAELREKKQVIITERELLPLHDMQELKGKYDELMSKEFYSKLNTDDYFRIILTDEIPVVNSASKLQTVYKNLMKVEVENERSKYESNISEVTDVERKTPIELFQDFYLRQTGREPDERQSEYIKKILENIKEDEA